MGRGKDGRTSLRGRCRFVCCSSRSSLGMGNGREGGGGLSSRLRVATRTFEKALAGQVREAMASDDQKRR